MDTANFSQQLRVLPTLVKTLAEDDSHKFKLSAQGHLSVLRKTRWMTGKTPLDVDAVRSLAAEVAARGEEAVLGPWFLCVLRGADGLTIFGERRLELPSAPLPDEVREELLQLARAGSTGLVAGGVGSQKGSVLLWLASQLGRRELVIVSDLPPRQLPAPTATHVFPPRNERERRNLERLLRAHDCIFWDRINRSEDLVSFATAPGSHNRWFSIDASSPAALGRRLRSLVAALGALRLDSCMFVEVNAQAEPLITSLCRHEDAGWTELLPSGPTLTRALDALGDILEASDRADAPPVQKVQKKIVRKRPPSPQAGIISPKRVGASSKSIVPGADQPPEEPTVNSTIEPLGEDTAAGLDQSIDASSAAESRGMSVAELEKGDTDETELLRQSGEIDLQAFVKARNARRQQHQRPSAPPEPSGIDEPPSGLGLEASSDHAVTDIADGAKVDAMLAQMAAAKANGERPRFPDVDPDKLTPPVRDETTALTPVDMERIRESADDDLSWLLGDSLGEPNKAEETLLDIELPPEIYERDSESASPIWEADPAPTDELSTHSIQESRSDWTDSEDT